MFLLCFSYLFFSFIFHFSTKTGEWTKTKNRERTSLIWKKLKPNFSKIHWGVWREKHLTTFIIDSLTNQLLWTKTIRLMAPDSLMLSPDPNFWFSIVLQKFKCINEDRNWEKNLLQIFFAYQWTYASSLICQKTRMNNSLHLLPRTISKY